MNSYNEYLDSCVFLDYANEHWVSADEENIEGPYYIHLGAANSIKSIRDMMEER